MLLLFFLRYGDHQDLHVLTHSYPTRRSSDLFMTQRIFRHALAIALTAAAFAAPAASQQDPDAFTIAVIPDTQNYIDVSHQREAGFPIDAKEIFFDQMEYIARNARSAGGDIVFATAVGDIWQHGSKPIDAKHAAMGQKSISNPVFGAYLNPEPKTLSVEMPPARAGYSIFSEIGREHTHTQATTVQ